MKKEYWITAILVLIGIGIISYSLWNYFTCGGGGCPYYGNLPSLEPIKNKACKILIQQHNCEVDTNILLMNGFDADGDEKLDHGTNWDWNNPDSETNQDNLAALCYYQYGRTNEADCKRLCNCPGV